MIRNLFLTLFLIAVLLFPVTALADDAQGWPLPREGYTLEQVVVLSRHSIRSPLSGKGSVLGEITPHEFRCAAGCWKPRWASISASGWRPRG